MRAYTVNYKMYDADEVHKISFLAKDKYDAYDKATFELIPEKEGHFPYSSWVSSVTYQNGNCKLFNTWEGLPY
ncbi:MAG: hypothetical protein IJH34_17360 [Romboutsia sp.]|nr:hypothetical protein [Romboutsia sp.]